jgi:hypothetical protein
MRGLVEQCFDASVLEPHREIRKVFAPFSVGFAPKSTKKRRRRSGPMHRGKANILVRRIIFPKVSILGNCKLTFRNATITKVTAVKIGKDSAKRTHGVQVMKTKK